VVEAVAPAIQAVVSALPFAIQTGIDAVAARFQVIGQMRASMLIGPAGAPIVSGFDPVSHVVQSLFDPVALAIQAMVDPIAEIAGGGAAGDAQQQYGKQQHRFVLHGLVLVSEQGRERCRWRAVDLAAKGFRARL
jgi:hypothetical protein